MPPVGGSSSSEHQAGVGLLTNCPACGREVSRAARTCPHCGHALHAPRLNVRLLALGMGVLLVATMAAVGLGITLRQSSTPSPLTTEQVIALVQPSVVTVKVDVFRGGSD